MQTAPPTRQRILVRGVNWLGDAVMTTPALQRLRERFPEAHLALLTHEKLAGLWQQQPGLDQVLSFGASESVWSVARRLRTDRFETTLIFPNSPRSALEMWLAQIPRRFGHSRPWRDWLLTDVVSPRPGGMLMHKRSGSEIKRLIASTSGAAQPPARITFPAAAHQIHEYLHLTAALGASPEPLAPRLVVAPEQIKTVLAKFRLDKAAAGSRPVFALSVGAEYGPAKRWPLERFIEVAREIQRRTQCAWLLLGGSSDLPAAAAAHAALRPSESSFLLAGQTSLPELMAVLKLCRALLTNDTGPMHVAAALGVPVVVPFGSTSPELTGPGMPGDTHHHLLKSDAACAPCFRRSCPIDFRCMTGIPSERVIEAVLATARES